MIRETYEEIKNGVEVRKNLINLRQALKAESSKTAFLYYLAGDYSVLELLLKHEDPKVRKNTALIIGELGLQDFLETLFTLYNNEEKLFVKADYLVAMSKLDYRSYISELKKRLEELVTSKAEEGSVKHLNEEKKVLTKMILDIEGVPKHTFTGYDVMSDLILLTNRDHKEITLNQIQHGKAKVFNAGVVVRTDALKEILEIRTYSELLFRIRGQESIPAQPQQAAESILKGGIIDFLKERHNGTSPYYFRLEIKSKMPLDEKSQFAKKLAMALEEYSDRQLINSTSNYEIELRLIQNKEGQFNVLVKLYSLPDERFSYRKHAVAASIQPARAALVAELAKPYLKQDAQVLDPFCGVGTMLIERNKLVKATPMYGIDIFGEAIDKGIENAKRARTIINFINRDFFDFKHEYLFDEIFTNMPAKGPHKSEAELEILYRSFFNKALSVLKDEGMIILYTRNRAFVHQGIDSNKALSLVKEFTISIKEEAYLCIIKVEQV